METIQELKNKIVLLERQDSENAWKEWYDKGKMFLEGLVGRCFIYSTSGFIQVFKVVGIKSQGVWTSRTPGYFEMKTEGYFTIHSAKYDFSERFSIPYPEKSPYGTFGVERPKFSVKDKRTLSQLHYKGQSLNETCCVTTSRVAKLGRYVEKDGEIKYSEYAVCKPKPEKSVKDEFFGMGVYEVDPKLYNDALDIANKIASMTDEFWNKHEGTLKDAKRVTD